MKRILLKTICALSLILGLSACAGWNVNPGINIVGGPHGVRVVPSVGVDFWGKPL